MTNRNTPDTKAPTNTIICNRFQHGQRLDLARLATLRDTCQERLAAVFPTVGDLDDQNAQLAKRFPESQQALVLRLGVSMLLRIMEFLRLPEITVSGCAIRYGIIRRKMLEGSGAAAHHLPSAA